MTVTTGISFYWKKVHFLVFVFIVLIHSTSDSVEDYGYSLGILNLSTIHYIAVFLKPRTYTLYITALYWSISHYTHFNFESAIWSSVDWNIISSCVSPITTAAVNLVHLMTIIAVLCLLYYQLQRCLHKILELFFKLRHSTCSKVKTVKTFLKHYLAVANAKFIFHMTLSSWLC